MLQTMKLTSKRQVTIPVTLCDELGVKPGDELYLERNMINGHVAWHISTKSVVDKPWFGKLNKYTKGKDHNMDSIRKSIGRRLDGEKR